MGNLAIYATKGFEYLLILGFLASFTIFYLYFTSHKFERAASVVSSSIDSLVDWFRTPENVLFHQGHTWARPEAGEPGLVLVGMDDFAQKMAGPMRIRNNPAVGHFIRQGERSWSLQEDDKTIDMLAPISGEVVEVNRTLLAELGKKTSPLNTTDLDPYEKGWILKVKPENFDRDQKGLLSGTLATKWMAETANQLRLKMSPELGAVMQDGGEPITGMAKVIGGEDWDKLLKEFFMT
jgi:glycine cleavage system H protein